MGNGPGVGVSLCIFLPRVICLPLPNTTGLSPSVCLPPVTRPRVYKILICIMRFFMHYEKVYCSSGFIVLKSGLLPEINSV